MKSEDAQAELKQKTDKESTHNTVTSVGSVDSQNLIMQSIKEALIAMNEKDTRMKGTTTNPYERMIQ